MIYITTRWDPRLKDMSRIQLSRLTCLRLESKMSKGRIAVGSLGRELLNGISPLYWCMENNIYCIWFGLSEVAGNIW